MHLDSQFQLLGEGGRQEDYTQRPHTIECVFTLTSFHGLKIAPGSPAITGKVRAILLKNKLFLKRYCEIFLCADTLF